MAVSACSENNQTLLYFPALVLQEGNGSNAIGGGVNAISGHQDAHSGARGYFT